MAKPDRPLRPSEIAKLLRADGWVVKRKGPGDHVQYVHPAKPGKVTLDMGGDPVPTGTLRSIWRQAGWAWWGRREAMPSTVAVVHREGGVSGVSFPDFPGVVATGRTPEEAVRRASEALSFHVAGMVEDGDAVPLPRSVEELERDATFREDRRDAMLALVSYELPTRAVRINITVEESLLGAIDRAAKASGQSRSAFLAEAARLRMRAAP